MKRKTGFIDKVLVCLFEKFSPTLLEKLPHVVTGSTNVRIVFIEFFAVIKHQVDINDKSLQVLILAANKLFPYCRKVHGFLDDLLVSRD